MVSYFNAAPVSPDAAMKLPDLFLLPTLLGLYFCTLAKGQDAWNPLDFPGQPPVGPPPGGPPLLPPLPAASGNEYTITNLGGGFAYGTNDGGQVVGSTGSQAILYSGTGSGNTLLGTHGGTSSTAYDINNHGLIVGTSRNSDGAERATIFSGTGSGNTDVGTLGGNYSGAHHLNDMGTIVGTASAPGTLYTSTLFSGNGTGNSNLGNLGYFESIARGINNRGQIVGSVSGPLTFTSGFVRLEGVVSELITLAATSAAAQGITGIAVVGNGTINEFGQIAAVGNLGSNNPSALLLNPSTPLSVTGQNYDHLPVHGARLVAGMTYDKVASLSTLSADLGEGVQVSLLSGVAGSGGTGNYGHNRSVSISFAPGTSTTYGHTIALLGTENDILAMQLTYEEAELIALFGSENAALGWLNDSGVWVNAVDGNTGGTATFVEGAWNSSYGLGTYGINRATNSVWAVINHNSSFSIIQPVPEPSAFQLSAFASLALLRRRVIVREYSNY